jgi:hypothetical protein
MQDYRIISLRDPVSSQPLFHIFDIAEEELFCTPSKMVYIMFIMDSTKISL